MCNEMPWSYIKEYHPLDLAGDAIWIPIPRASSKVFDMGYDPESALYAWGIKPITYKGGFTHHPEDKQIVKYTFPKKWIVQYRGRSEWSICDQQNHERIRVIYQAYDLDYIVLSHLSVPFNIRSHISNKELLPEAAQKILKDTYPEFPHNPNAYW